MENNAHTWLWIGIVNRIALQLHEFLWLGLLLPVTAHSERVLTDLGQISRDDWTQTFTRGQDRLFQTTRTVRLRWINTNREKAEMYIRRLLKPKA